MTLAAESLIETGIYTPKQAARYARLRSQTLSRWVHGTSGGEPALRAELQDDPDRFVTFVDFVQAMAIRAIRREKEIPLQTIRNVVDKAWHDYNVKYPFAVRHTTYRFGDDIVLRLSDDRIVQLTGEYKDHQLINEVVEEYAEDLYYDPETGLACRYEPMAYRGRTIVLDPKVKFGQPTVQPCGYAVDVLVNARLSEGSVARAASAYGLHMDDIRIAQRYHDWLLGVAA